MKKMLILMLAMGTLSLSGCMGFTHGDHMGGHSDRDYDSRYDGRAGGGHSH